LGRSTASACWAGSSCSRPTRPGWSRCECDGTPFASQLWCWALAAN
jgi:hypothetical protein